MIRGDQAKVQASISLHVFKLSRCSSLPPQEFKFSIEDQGFKLSSLWRDLVHAFKIHHSNPRSSHHDGVIFLQDPLCILKTLSSSLQGGFQAYNHGGLWFLKSILSYLHTFLHLNYIGISIEYHSFIVRFKSTTC